MTDWLSTLTPDARELAEERMAIMEHDGGLTRDEAEAKTERLYGKMLANGYCFPGTGNLDHESFVREMR